MAATQPALYTLAELAVTAESLLAQLDEAESHGHWADVDAIKTELDYVEQEYARQRRIANGVETACARCGCSESRPCPGGCLWATALLCSRCI